MANGDKWMTPPKLYKELDDEFDFNYDPCPIDWKEGDEDGLTTEWGTRTFCNPPYSKVAPWIKKASEESKKGKLVVMLINCITDTVAFHEYIYGKHEVRFLKGRVSFVNPNNPTRKTPNPKPSMIVIFSGEKNKN